MQLIIEHFGVIVTALQAIIVVVLSGMFALWAARQKKSQAESEERAAVRAEESRLSMSLMSANVKLSVATAKAVRDGKCNGSMSDALDGAENSQGEYYKFINTVAARQITAQQ